MPPVATTAPASPARAPVEAPAAPPRRGIPPLAILIGTAAIITASSIAAYYNGKGGIDLAIFHQGLYVASRHLTARAGIIQETLFEDHFAPGMLVFVGLYKIIVTPLWLLLAQGGAAFAAAKLIADRLRPALGARRSAWVGAALLISPPVAYCLLWDFHFVVIAVPFALAAAFSLEDGRPRRALLFGLLAAMFRLDVGLAVLAAFAVLPGSRRGRLRPAAVLFAYVMVGEYMEQHLGHAIFWPMHYAHLGTGPVDALLHPWRVVTTLVSGRAASKAVLWVGTSALLCFLRPRLAIPAAVVALPVLLSHWPGTDQFFFQYGLAPTFLLALAWIPAVKRAPELGRRVIAGSVALGFLLGPVLPAIAFPAFGYSYAASRWIPNGEVRCVVRDIPVGAGVSAESHSLSLLAARDDAYLWPFPFAPAPADTLPGPQHRHAIPDAAARVDYLIVDRDSADPIPPGFTPDGETAGLLRFRRTATTTAVSHPCTS